ncbi:MAG: hypothetical protein R2712_13330 [Vicinamibacterales bacterium]
MFQGETAADVRGLDDGLDSRAAAFDEVPPAEAFDPGGNGFPSAMLVK